VVQRASAAAAGNRLVEDAPPRHLFHILAEVADRQFFRDRDFPLVRRLFPHDHAKERRLASAVRPDQADLFAGIELKRRVDEQNLTTVLLADSIERDHRVNWLSSGSCQC
jgi:hypothetical protein